MDTGGYTAFMGFMMNQLASFLAFRIKGQVNLFWGMITFCIYVLVFREKGDLSDSPSLLKNWNYEAKKHSSSQVWFARSS